MNFKFVEFAMYMGESSLELIEKGKYHSGVYLGGYLLEGYLKDFLINRMKYEEKDIFVHLNQEKVKKVILHKEVEEFLRINMDLLTDSLLANTHSNYPKLLIEGGENNETQKRWDVHERYNIKQWSEKEYALKIKEELQNILSEIVDKYLTEGGI